VTSKAFNERKRAAQEEMDLFDRLPPSIQSAIKSSPVSVKSKTVWDALVRGVPASKIVETIENSKGKLR